MISVPRYKNEAGPHNLCIHSRPSFAHLSVSYFMESVQRPKLDREPRTPSGCMPQPRKRPSGTVSIVDASKWRPLSPPVPRYQPYPAPQARRAHARRPSDTWSTSPTVDHNHDAEVKKSFPETNIPGMLLSLLKDESDMEYVDHRPSELDFRRGDISSHSADIEDVQAFVHVWRDAQAKLDDVEKPKGWTGELYRPDDFQTVTGGGIVIPNLDDPTGGSGYKAIYYPYVFAAQVLLKDHVGFRLYMGKVDVKDEDGSVIGVNYEGAWETANVGEWLVPCHTKAESGDPGLGPTTDGLAPLTRGVVVHLPPKRPSSFLAKEASDDGDRSGELSPATYGPWKTAGLDTFSAMYQTGHYPSKNDQDESNPRLWSRAVPMPGLNHGSMRIVVPSKRTVIPSSDESDNAPLYRVVEEKSTPWVIDVPMRGY